MTEFNHGAFMAELRRQVGKVPQDLYEDIMAALEAGLRGKAPAPGPSGHRPDEPAWLVEARRHMGLKEIPGKAHNATILGWVKSLGGWFKDDETPWCGTFVAACMQVAGHKVPQHWYRAKAWAEWGKPCVPTVGAIAVFGRTGGGHVGFLVGANDSYFYVLGGNQSNQVNIMPIARNRLVPKGVRWPASMAVPHRPLPVMSGGTVSRNEA